MNGKNKIRCQSKNGSGLVDWMLAIDYDMSKMPKIPDISQIAL